MSRSPTSAELSSTSCYPNTRLASGSPKLLCPSNRCFSIPKIRKSLGFGFLFNGLLQNHTSFRIDLPFPVALDIANLLGKSPMAPLVHQWLYLSTGPMGWKNSGQVSRVVPVQDQGLAAVDTTKNDELLPSGSNWINYNIIWGIYIYMNIQYINCKIYPNYLGIKYRWNS